MHLIKIGENYINLANATAIYDLLKQPYAPKNRIDIEFIGRNGEDYGSAMVEAEEADALRRYLSRVATNLLSPEQTDSDFQQYRSRGGEMTYADWKASTDRMMSYHNRGEQFWNNPRNQQMVSDLEAELKL